ncbi:MAG: hypothetical protein ABIC91_00380 [Nanoarchaeota archaeon]|nr:hypothetical protein [Nanoarchaeota archaeon]MBU1030580.1 hypothetical protein [Nanoarchaeota archaeon]MBU1849129.1 hypothetical protein [Nanoarchaeota archaeon]
MQVYISEETAKKGKKYAQFGIDKQVEVASIITGKIFQENIFLDDLNIPNKKDILLTEIDSYEDFEKIKWKNDYFYEVISAPHLSAITEKYHSRVDNKKIIGKNHNHLVTDRLIPSSGDIMSCLWNVSLNDYTILLIYDLNADFSIFGFRKHLINDFMNLEILDFVIDSWLEENYEKILVPHTILPKQDYSSFLSQQSLLKPKFHPWLKIL